MTAQSFELQTKRRVCRKSSVRAHLVVQSRMSFLPWIGTWHRRGLFVALSAVVPSLIFWQGECGANHERTIGEEKSEVDSKEDSRYPFEDILGRSTSSTFTDSNSKCKAALTSHCQPRRPPTWLRYEQAVAMRPPTPPATEVKPRNKARRLPLSRAVA